MTFLRTKLSSGMKVHPSKMKKRFQEIKASIFIFSKSKIINDVSTILNRVAEKSDRLLGNYTTNLAESWMHIRT